MPRSAADYGAAIKKVREEQPDMQDTPIEPAGFFGRMLRPDAQAITNPFTGSVSYNPDNMGNMGQDELENTFTHELAHTRQVQQQPYLSRFTGMLRSMMPVSEQYHERPNEMEAFQAERNRSLSHHLDLPDPVTLNRDIQLPSVSKRRAIISGR